MTPDGSGANATEHSTEEHFTYKVDNGQVIDAWVKLTNGGQVMATLQTTVDCSPEQPQQPVEEDTPEQTTGVASGFPHTGGSAVLAWMAAAVTALGYGALRLSRREVAIAE